MVLLQPIIGDTLNYYATGDFSVDFGRTSNSDFDVLELDDVVITKEPTSVNVINDELVVRIDLEQNEANDENINAALIRIRGVPKQKALFTEFQKNSNRIRTINLRLKVIITR